ncbi:MAG: insulinase family protein [Clostridia bacterium]|nr:insulinase family protein [Clostridia bacterium]
MNYKKIEIKKGVNLHTINTNKFKTNLLAIFITTPLSRENVTKNSLIPMILRSGSILMPSQAEISINLEEMYGASFDCGIDKTGDNHVLRFYLEAINDKFLPNNEKILEKAINNIIDIVFNPLIEKEQFNEEYINREKENLKQIIEGKIDNKAVYATDRCVEEMYKDKPYGLYRFGYIEDLEKINSENLYEYYKELINTCKIDIFVSGEITEDVQDIVCKNEIINKLEDRETEFIKESSKSEPNEERQIEERMDITQGKLVIGLDVETENRDEKYVALLYNAILRRNSKF